MLVFCWTFAMFDQESEFSLFGQTIYSILCQYKKFQQKDSSYLTHYSDVETFVINVCKDHSSCKRNSNIHRTWQLLCGVSLLLCLVCWQAWQVIVYFTLVMYVSRNFILEAYPYILTNICSVCVWFVPNKDENTKCIKIKQLGFIYIYQCDL